MIRLTAQQVILLQSDLIRETGGEDGLCDEGLLDAALNAPFASFDGLDVYPSVQQKAARLCFAAGIASFDELLNWLVDHQQYL